ncbi:MAG: hypothetical protein ACRD6W_06655 [Nitrososphaerales archaeon]
MSTKIAWSHDVDDILGTHKIFSGSMQNSERNSPWTECTLTFPVVDQKHDYLSVTLPWFTLSKQIRNPRRL